MKLNPFSSFVSNPSELFINCLFDSIFIFYFFKKFTMNYLLIVKCMWSKLIILEKKKILWIIIIYNQFHVHEIFPYLIHSPIEVAIPNVRVENEIFKS
jgi:hypothetical protein